MVSNSTLQASDIYFFFNFVFLKALQKPNFDIILSYTGMLNLLLLSFKSTCSTPQHQNKKNSFRQQTYKVGSATKKGEIDLHSLKKFNNTVL